MSVHSIFQNPAFANITKPGAHGAWTRFVIERPNQDPQGSDRSPWVAVLDDAIVKQSVGSRQCLWGGDRSRHQMMQNVFFEPFVLQVNPRDLLKGFGLNGFNTKVLQPLLENTPQTERLTLPEDASARARTWCGPETVIGFKGDTPVLTRTFPLCTLNAPCKHFLTKLVWLMTHLDPKRCEGTGVGWGLPDCDQGDETFRLPERTQHANILSRRLWGTPKNWDIVTGRVHITLMTKWVDG